MTPPAKTLIGSKINYFQGSIALCHTGSIARGFSNIRSFQDVSSLFGTHRRTGKSSRNAVVSGPFTRTQKCSSTDQKKYQEAETVRIINAEFHNNFATLWSGWFNLKQVILHEHL